MLWSILFLSVCAAVVGQLNPTAPVVSDCGGDMVIIVMQENMKSNGGDELDALSGSTLGECSEACREDDGCVGFDYDRGLEECILYADLDPADLSEDSNVDFYQKSCVTTERVCSSPFIIEMKPQFILIGFAREVVTVPTVDECFLACLESLSDFGFECESAMYYPNDEECILNTEDRRDRPDVFVEETTDEVIYFDNNCAGSQCFAPYVTQYIQVQDKVLAGEMDVRLLGYEPEACVEFCTNHISQTGDRLNCKSFMYDFDNNECILSDERSTPLGRAELVDQPGTNYYEKKCFESPNTCRNVPSFDRVPQMILVGFAAFVLENVPSVTMCLDSCVDPPADTGADFECKSAMYYYNEQECILNVETRESKPDLFIPEGEGFKVDYFDIVCKLEEEPCRGDQAARAIKQSDTTLETADEFGTSFVLEELELTPRECGIECILRAPEKCRSFNYYKDVGACELLYLSSETAKTQSSPGSDYYEVICFEGANTGECKESLSITNRMIGMENLAPITDIPPGPNSIVECLKFCINQPGFDCAGANYNKKTGECQLFEVSTEGADLVPNDDVDYYESICAGDPVTTTQRPETTTVPATAAPLPAGVETTCNFDGLKVTVTNSEPFTGAVFAKMKYDTCRIEVKDEQMAMLMLGFPDDKKADAAAPSQGYRRMKRQYGDPAPASSYSQQQGGPVPQPSTYGQQPQQAGGYGPANPTATPPSTAPVRDCGVEDLMNGTYKATIVVQSNNLGIPGLVTSMDQIYEVACDYSSMTGQKVAAEAAMQVDGPTAAIIQPRGKIELSSPVQMQMMMSGAAPDERPVLQANLGDVLELRWEMMALDDQMDFFVRECVAERGGSSQPTPSATGGYGGAATPADTEGRLQLIEKGCPTAAVAQKLMPEPIVKESSKLKTTKLQAFRFDGSRSVRIICQLEICEGECNPTTCDLNGENVESFGRKKRDLGDESHVQYDPFLLTNKLETSNYVLPRRQKAMASLVIVDPLQQVHAPSSHRSQTRHVQLQPQTAFQERLPIEYSRQGQVCLPKSTFVGVFLFLGLLTLAQAAVVTGYVAKRLFSSKV